MTNPGIIRSCCRRIFKVRDVWPSHKGAHASHCLLIVLIFTDSPVTIVLFWLVLQLWMFTLFNLIRWSNIPGSNRKGFHRWNEEDTGTVEAGWAKTGSRSDSWYKCSSGEIMSTEEVVATWVLSGPEAGPAWPEGTVEIRKGVSDNAPAGGLCATGAFTGGKRWLRSLRSWTLANSQESF